MGNRRDALTFICPWLTDADADAVLAGEDDQGPTMVERLAHEETEHREWMRLAMGLWREATGSEAPWPGARKAVAEVRASRAERSAPSEPDEWGVARFRARQAARAFLAGDKCSRGCGSRAEPGPWHLSDCENFRSARAERSAPGAAPPSVCDACRRGLGVEGHGDLHTCGASSDAPRTPSRTPSRTAVTSGSGTRARLCDACEEETICTERPDGRWLCARCAATA